ncbi:hypothetical protein ACJMK2_020536 [Sinanodonta woodiana]|uniref:Uncharacterized protein n=1 Tax=Sinanodonta woodiana TaxID=1069815 RepID=A0ABD3U0I1_SINWO
MLPPVNSWEFRDYIDINKDVVTDGVITNEDIVSACSGRNTTENSTVGSFVGDETVLESISNIEAFVFKQTVKGKKQQSILDFVKKPN